jgi:phosphoenolpyruvate-protein phosphotransferase (PTS system enzyme I)
MKTERRFQGVAVSPGIARGTAYVYRADDDVPPRRSAPDVEGEIRRFEQALAVTREQILKMQEQVAAAVGAKDAAIFDAHLLVVEDSMLTGEVTKMLQAERCNVEHAVSTVVQRYVRTLAGLEDAYFRERSADILDVTRRIIHNLLGKDIAGLASLDAPHVVLAHAVSPSDTAQMNRANVLGFATEVGGRTSHAAILARSLAIPAVIGLHRVLDQVENGEEVLLDGYAGIFIVNPTTQTLFEYGEFETRKKRVETELTELRETASTTRDGRHVILSANIEAPEDVGQVVASGAEGVGLFRTEFIYLQHRDFPTEEEQFEAYWQVAHSVQPHPVIIRTLDLGGDKMHGDLHATKEENPFLGWRAIRVCLERTDLFRTQLRAILRASVAGNVKLMFPMISGLGELRCAKEILAECRDELRKEGKTFDEKMEVGMMIEVPSAAMIADLLAKEVDFFSLGTNDLVQYTVAADRTNERIAHLYEPTHPGVIRLMKQTVDAAHANGIWVGVCGEMGGDIALTPLLLGLGVDELSCGAAVLPRVKRAVRSLDHSTCQQLVQAALACDTGSDILARTEEVARSHYGDLI